MPHLRRRLLVGAVALISVAGAAVVVATVSSGPRREVATTAPKPGSPTQTSCPTGPTRTSTTPPSVTSAPNVVPTTTATTTTTAPPAPSVLSEGATGAGVIALQERLTALGYWLGAEHGIFGSATAHAVVAFQKGNGLARDGIVGPIASAKLRTAIRLQPRSTSGPVIEIDLNRQLLLDVHNGRVTWVFDTSTGSVPGTTPIGHWNVYQEVDGWVYGSLGVLYRPKFFHGNVAIHGNPSVPPYPASHGCVRVINAAMDWLWASGDLPIGTSVWVY
jgi:hypothetical protein